ncbi:hypothetical protein [Shewanella algae]|uniref:hypothetical protein n=1 Tax=Shewanella algae TaxID=38313 RepID=UPI0031F5A8AD
MSSENLFNVLSSVVADRDNLSDFSGAKLSTAELISVMGSALDITRRRERLIASGSTQEDIERLLLEEAQQRLEQVKHGSIVPSRCHGNRSILSETD